MKSRDAEALPVLEAAIAAEKDPLVRTQLQLAWAAVTFVKNDSTEAKRLEAIALLDASGSRDALSILRTLPADTAGPVRAAANTAIKSIEDRLALWGYAPERLVRRLARIGAAARRDRSRDHLRRDGRHQHGARRDGHARRLHDLRRPGADPHQRAVDVRILAGDRHSARVPRRRRRRRRSSNAASFAISTAVRSKRCSRPGASA